MHVWAFTGDLAHTRCSLVGFFMKMNQNPCSYFLAEQARWISPNKPKPHKSWLPAQGVPLPLSSHLLLTFRFPCFLLQHTKPFIWFIWFYSNTNLTQRYPWGFLVLLGNLRLGSVRGITSPRGGGTSTRGLVEAVSSQQVVWVPGMICSGQVWPSVSASSNPHIDFTAALLARDHPLLSAGSPTPHPGPSAGLVPPPLCVLLSPTSPAFTSSDPSYGLPIFELTKQQLPVWKTKTELSNALLYFFFF